MRSVTAALLLLAACAAPVTWTKDGASQPAIDADLQNCRMAAALAPNTQQRHGMPYAISGRGGLSVDEEAIHDRSRQEAELVQKCMQEKGYRIQ